MQDCPRQWKVKYWARLKGGGGGGFRRNRRTTDQVCVVSGIGQIRRSQGKKTWMAFCRGVASKRVWCEKGGSLWKSGPLYTYVWKMRFFCDWLIGFLPYVATKCTANKKKKPSRKVFWYQVPTDTLFTMEQRQKRPPEQVQQTFEHTGAACWFCLVTIKGDRTCGVVRLEVPNGSQNEKTKSPSTCKQTKKKKE